MADHVQLRYVKLLVNTLAIKFLKTQFIFFTFKKKHVKIKIIYGGILMSNRSIPAFVIGLISSIVGAITAYVFWLVFVLIGAVSGGTIKIILNIFPFINLATFAISFIGCFFCLKRSRIGGLIMILSSALSLICFTVICVALKTVNLIFVLFWLPTIFILVAGMIGYKKKKDSPSNTETHLST